MEDNTLDLSSLSSESRKSNLISRRFTNLHSFQQKPLQTGLASMNLETEVLTQGGFERHYEDSIELNDSLLDKMREQFISREEHEAAIGQLTQQLFEVCANVATLTQALSDLRELQCSNHRSIIPINGIQKSLDDDGPTSLRSQQFDNLPYFSTPLQQQERSERGELQTVPEVAECSELHATNSIEDNQPLLGQSSSAAVITNEGQEVDQMIQIQAQIEASLQTEPILLRKIKKAKKKICILDSIRKPEPVGIVSQTSEEANQEPKEDQEQLMLEIQSQIQRQLSSQKVLPMTKKRVTKKATTQSNFDIYKNSAPKINEEQDLDCGSDSNYSNEHVNELSVESINANRRLSMGKTMSMQRVESLIRYRVVNNTSVFIEDDLTKSNTKARQFMRLCNQLGVSKGTFQNMIKRSQTEMVRSESKNSEAKSTNENDFGELITALNDRTEPPTLIELQDQLDKNTIKTNVILGKLHDQRKQDDEREALIRKLVDLIPSIFYSVKQLEKDNKVSKMDLHFAFMFACPLVMMHTQKPVPQLNYDKEFLKIRERIESTWEIKYQKRQCTYETITEVLNKRPFGIHFSGHGISKLQVRQGKDEGDYLLLETETGEGSLISRDKLKELVDKTHCELEFVVMLTCHSQDQGEIFIQVGARHVICIAKEQEVADEAAVTFTDTFYKLVFQDNIEVCLAFELARNNVGIKHSPDEERKFLLLVKEQGVHQINYRFSVGLKNVLSSTNFSNHKCRKLLTNQLKEGKCIDTLETNSILSQKTRKVELIGREQIAFELLQKLLSPFNKIYTVWGQHGVGKTAVVNSVMHYIRERSLIKGGFIWVDSVGIINIEVFARKLSLSVIEENEHLFGWQKKEIYEEMNRDCFSIFRKVVNQLSQLGSTIVFIIENCEGLIKNVKQEFKDILTYLQKEVELCKIVLTTTMRLKDSNEELMIVNGLSPQHALALFRKSAKRTISIKEEEELLKATKDKITRQKLHEHDLFKKIGGNPQSILLIAPLLSDPEKKLSLLDLYKMLNSEKIDEILSSENMKIEEGMTASMRISLETAFRSINEDDDESLDLFFIVSVFPGGIFAKDLDIIWTELRVSAAKQMFKDLAQLKPEIIDISWHRAFQRLVGSQLLDKCADLSPTSLITMPTYIRNFAQFEATAQNEQKCEALQKLVTQFLLQKHVAFYRAIDRDRNTKDSKEVNEDDFILQFFKGGNVNMGYYFEQVQDLLIDREVAVQDFEPDWEKFLHFGTLASKRQGSFHHEIERFNSIVQVAAEVMTLPSRSLKLSVVQKRWQYAIKKVIEQVRKAKAINAVSLAEDFVFHSEAAHDSFLTIPRRVISGKISQALQTKQSSLQQARKDEDNPKRKSLSDNIEYAIKSRYSESCQQLEKDIIRSSFRAKKSSLQPLQSRVRRNDMDAEAIGTRLSMGLDQTTEPALMGIEEYIGVIYITNLYISGMDEIASQIIENKLSKLNLATDLFKGNLKRINALCTFKAFEKEVAKGELSHLALLTKVDRTLKLLKESENYFERSAWGKGLVFFQMGLVYETVLDKGLVHKQEQDIGDHELSTRFSDEIKKLYNLAFDQFTAINHLRGQALAANAIAKRLSSNHRATDDELMQDDNNSHSSFFTDDSIKQESLIFQEKYKEKMKAFKLVKVLVDRDSCITRNQGEVFSLLTEVVKSCSDGPLFDQLRRQNVMFEKQEKSINKQFETTIKNQ